MEKSGSQQNYEKILSSIIFGPSHSPISELVLLRGALPRKQSVAKFYEFRFRLLKHCRARIGFGF